MQFIFSHHFHHPPFLKIIHIFWSLKKMVEILYLTLVPHLPISCLLSAIVNHYCQFLMCPSRVCIYIYIYIHTHTHTYSSAYCYLFSLPQKRRCYTWRGAHCFFHLPIFLGGPFQSSTQRVCLFFLIATISFIIWMYIIYLFPYRWTLALVPILSLSH